MTEMSKVKCNVCDGRGVYESACIGTGQRVEIECYYCEGHGETIEPAIEVSKVNGIDELIADLLVPVMSHSNAAQTNIQRVRASETLDAFLSTARAFLEPYKELSDEYLEFTSKNYSTDSWESAVGIITRREIVAVAAFRKLIAPPNNTSKP